MGVYPGTMRVVTRTLQTDARFARRTDWDRSPSELHGASLPVIEDMPPLDLTESNPTNCGFERSASDILEPLQNPESLHYRPEPKGLLSARESIAAYYLDHRASVSPEQILLTASTSEAYSHLFRLLCEAGDEILIAQPSYPLFAYLADLSDVILRTYPLFYDHGWWIDMAELERAINPRTRAIVVVHPNNPTGHATSVAERDYLQELCRRHQMTLIVDEVFLDYPHSECATLESFATSVHPSLTFVLSGLSKIVALPQMKLGWILALGPDQERLEALARLEIIADTFLSVSAPSQLALPEWLGKAAGIQQQLRGRITSNYDLLRAANLDLDQVEAGWNAILRLPRIFSQETAFEVLRDRAILTHPAHFYGLNDPNRVVLSLIVAPCAIQQAVTRIGDLLVQGCSSEGSGTRRDF